MAIIYEFGTAPAARELGYVTLVGLIHGEANDLLEKFKDQDAILVTGAYLRGSNELYEFAVFRKAEAIAAAAEHEISYAYPTSPNAAKAGFAQTGCFVYQSGEAFHGLSTFGDAKTFALIAGTTPGRWSLDHPKNARMIP